MYQDGTISWSNQILILQTETTTIGCDCLAYHLQRTPTPHMLNHIVCKPVQMGVNECIIRRKRRRGRSMRKKRREENKMMAFGKTKTYFVL
jgi:hypothetical protein